MTVEMPQAEPGLKPEPGGFWIRAAARIIDDWVLYFCLRMAVVIVLAVAAGAFGAVMGWNVEPFAESLQKSTAISWIASVLAILCHHTFAEGIGGATIGKRVVGLQVTDESLRSCNITQGFKRSLAFFYDGLFFGLVAEGYMKDSVLKQRAGDEWARTVVVKRRSVSEHRSAGRLMVGWAAAIAAQVMLITIARLAEYAWLLRAG
jgi:uncharacterized RDD family membrane protein YckC